MTPTPCLSQITPSRRMLLGGAIALAAAGALTACSGTSSSSRSENTLRVVYQKTAAFQQLDRLLTKVKEEYEASQSTVTIELIPIEAEQDSYFTKLALMNGSPDTAPDIIYEDAFQIRTDVAAGYLHPIDEYVAKWEDWDMFLDSVKEAGKGEDDKLYGISLGTDTRGIFYNKKLFAQAGISDTWQPRTWDDILQTARILKTALPDVIPFNMYASKAFGEGTAMQSFEMLLYGTQDTLYDTDTKKWVTGSQGFKDALTFLKTIYDEGLAPGLDTALDANIGSRIATELLPQGRVAMCVDGSWLPGGWITGDNAWPEWEETIGYAAMPTQKGEDPGFTSMSGGWALSIGSQTKNPQAAFDFIALALNKENALKYYTENSLIAVRSDVAEMDEYLTGNSSFEFFSGLVQYTHFRPATPDYSQISGSIQIACEDVVTGGASPEEAAATYDKSLVGIVGDDMVQAG